MENNTGESQVPGSRFREWIDPMRLYNPTVGAGRVTFLWGLVIYPFMVMFVLLTAAIIAIESFSGSANAADSIGIVTYVFMLGWVAAAVFICRRRLLQLGKSQAWVWLAIVPLANLGLFLYLLLKSD